MAEVLSFTVDGRNLRVDLSLLAQHSSAPIGTWLDELMNAEQHGLTHDEVEVFLEAVEGRDSWRTNGMSEIKLGARCAILRLATRWQCEALRNLAIESLDKLLAPLEKLMIARAYRILHWLVPAYTHLALRCDPATVAEAQKLDAEDVVRIFSARENIFRHRLPAREEFVTEHFMEVVSNGDLAERTNPTSQTPLPVELPLSSSIANEAIIFSSPFPESISRPPDVPQHEEAERREEMAVGAVDISYFKSGRFDDGVALLSPENVGEVVAHILKAPNILSGTESKGRTYRRRGADLIVAALRRSVRESDFVPVAGQFVGAILDFLRRQWPNYHDSLSPYLQSLDFRWDQFIQTGAVPRKDKGEIMPSGLTPEAYRTCMANGQTFIAILADRGFVREWKWAAHAHTLTRQSTLTSMPSPPVHEPTPVGSRGASARIGIRHLPTSISSQSHPPDMDTQTSQHSARFPWSRLHATDKPSVDTIVERLTVGRADAGFAWITGANVDDVHRSYLAHLDRNGQPNISYSNLFSALLRRACDDREFHGAGRRFLLALCESRPELAEELVRPIDWVVANWKKFRRCPDMTPDPDGGRIIRLWRTPGMAPQVYKERAGNVSSFILDILERVPHVDAEWAATVRAGLA
ncbi:unnamed protein product [Peniophora sp. CBMAI 1063]|nr:unnamed protein product [Peniophora sp. CBMAI 1063]